MVLEERSVGGGVALYDAVVESPTASGSTTTTFAISAPSRRHSTRGKNGLPEKERVVLSSASGSQNLLFFEDAPRVLQYNRFIRSGYRAGYSYWDCARSVFRLHNETGNIWTHLAVLLVWAACAISGVIQPWDSARYVYYAATLTIFWCLLGSACYHTFMGCDCHYHNWLTLDVCGIYVLVLGTQWVAIQQGYACYPKLRFAAQVAYHVVGVLGVPSAWLARSAKQRGYPLLALSLLRLTNLFARPLLGGSDLKAFAFYASAEVVVVIGGIINVARVPEKFFQPAKPRTPAPFDNWLNSHQIMHVLVVGVMILNFLGLRLDVNFFEQPLAQCPA